MAIGENPSRSRPLPISRQVSNDLTERFSIRGACRGSAVRITIRAAAVTNEMDVVVAQLSWEEPENMIEGCASLVTDVLKRPAIVVECCNAVERSARSVWVRQHLQQRCR